MGKEKCFPIEVLKVLKDLEDNKDPRFPSMKLLTQEDEKFKNMWSHILKQPKRGPDADMSREDTVYCFLDMVIDCSKKEIPVFYLNEKEKQEKIKSILGHQEKLKKIYEELFDKEAVMFIGALCDNTNKAINKIECSYLRATGKKNARIAATFVREMAQRIPFIFIFKDDKTPNSVIRTAALGILNYNYTSDVSILKLTKERDQPPVFLD